MIILTDYQIEKKKDYYIIIPQESIKCTCGGEVINRGSKRRMLLSNDGERRIFAIKRVYCSSCDTLHSVLPDCVVPYKHFDRETIESVKNGTNDCCCADNATLYRWKKL